MNALNWKDQSGHPEISSSRFFAEKISGDLINFDSRHEEVELDPVAVARAEAALARL